MDTSDQAENAGQESLPLISVIVTAYNRANLLPRTLESLFAQTLQDFEVIIVDDASTDDTSTLIRNVSDSRVRYIRHESNRGAVHAYNTGIRASRGTYIACLDSNDTVRPSWLERLLAAFGSQPDIGMVWGWIRVHDGAGTSAIMYRDPFGNGSKRLLPKMLEWTPGIGSVLVRREVFDAIGLLDPDVGHMLDVDFAARFALSGSFRVDIVPEVLMDIYKQPGSLSGHIDEQYLQALRNYVVKYEPALSEYPCVHAEFLYRIGRVSELLGHDDADVLLRRAALLCPGNLRIRAYPLARMSGLSWGWHRVSSARTAMRGWYRERRHGDGVRQES